MAMRTSGIFERILDWRVMRHWARLADAAPGMSRARLRRLRRQGRQLRRQIDLFLTVADQRLAATLPGGEAIPLPLHADWAHRPALWRGAVVPSGVAAAASKTPFGDGVTLFHDCPNSSVTLRQLANPGAADLAPYALQCDVLDFEGTFLSLVIDLPGPAIEGLQKRHVIAVRAVIEAELPVEVFARLNIRHGPNTEQIVRELPKGAAEAGVEFDLAYCGLNEKRTEAMWLDLIFDNPRMNRVVLRDITFSRRPRADI